MARLAGPLIERHVRAVAVVGLERLPHDLEEVAQATGSQRMPQCGTGVPFAEHFVVDVRMRDTGSALGGIRVLGDNAIRIR